MSVKNIVTRIAGRSLVKVQKHSPEILTGVGIAAMVGSTVMAVRATPEAQDVFQRIKDAAEAAKGLRDDEHIKDYSPEQYRKDISMVYVTGGMQLVKTYGPAISLGAAGIASIVAAHGVMRKRNAALVATYKVLEEAYTQYRERVREELGEEKEFDLFHNLKEEEVHDTEAGVVTKTKVQNPNTHSPYARFFDEGSVNWKRDSEYNRVFLQAQQRYANDLLQARGHLFLNEVYDMLGLERSSAGQVVGWVISKDGDNFVDFGIFNQDSERARAFINGQEKSVLLDFNVDGVVYDLI